MTYILFAALFLTLLFFALLYLLYYKAFYHEPKEYKTVKLPKKWLGDNYDKCKTLYDAAAAEKYDEVYITAFDGTKLFGRLYIKDTKKPFVIMMHGYKGTALIDFCGGSAMINEFGYNKLIIDQRAHGKSGGHTITFGVKECRDCISWVEYLINSYGGDIKIGLIGVSMGAATVTMATGLDMPHQVKCVIADCGYSSPADIIRKVMRDMHMPTAFYPLVRLSAKIFGSFSPDEYSSIEAVKKSKTPLLIIHGEADSFVPCYMSREIFDACAAPKQILTVASADHAVSAFADEKAYKNAVNGFINKYLAC